MWSFYYKSNGQEQSQKTKVRTPKLIKQGLLDLVSWTQM
jgi:hypothetical protein